MTPEKSSHAWTPGTDDGPSVRSRTEIPILVIGTALAIDYWRRSGSALVRHSAPIPERPPNLKPQPSQNLRSRKAAHSLKAFEDAGLLILFHAHPASRRPNRNPE
jgi:hypothetical protein